MLNGAIVKSVINWKGQHKGHGHLCSMAVSLSDDPVKLVSIAINVLNAILACLFSDSSHDYKFLSGVVVESLQKHSRHLTLPIVPSIAFLVVLDILIQVFQVLGPAALYLLQNGGDPAAALCFLVLG